MFQQDIKGLEPIEFTAEAVAKRGPKPSVGQILSGVLAASVLILALTAIAGTGDASAAWLKPMVCGSSLTDVWALCS